jgi:hypothetical protein
MAAGRLSCLAVPPPGKAVRPIPPNVTRRKVMEGARPWRWARGHTVESRSSHGFAESFNPPHIGRQVIARILRTAGARPVPSF